MAVIFLDFPLSATRSRPSPSRSDSPFTGQTSPDRTHGPWGEGWAGEATYKGVRVRSTGGFVGFPRFLGRPLSAHKRDRAGICKRWR